MGGTAFASPIVLTKLKAASNSENIPKKHVSITLPVGKVILPSNSGHAAK